MFPLECESFDVSLIWHALSARLYTRESPDAAAVRIENPEIRDMFPDSSLPPTDMVAIRTCMYFTNC